MNNTPAHHFIGIGGVGMSAIAQVLHEQGVTVTGSDQAASSTSRRLADLGVSIHIGHAAENVAAADVVVVSTAVGPENPELKAALERGLVVKHRSEVLAELMARHRSIAVSGTHGKTTTTGMVASILLGADQDPTVLVGGELPLIGGTARTGKSPFLVAEADESDKSIRRLTAEIVILTNLEGDHLEHYRDLDEIYEVMLAFFASLPEHAQVVACVDDPGVRAILARIPRQVHTYGFSPEADYRIEGEVLEGTGGCFALNEVPFRTSVPGRHNVSNASAAIVVAYLLGLDANAVRPGLEAFTGVGRRFQIKGTEAGVTVVDDYAHHPTEIKATLQAAHLLNRPVWVVFQPHRYTRTLALFEDFADSFGAVRGVGVMDVYSAGEAPNGVTTAQLVERMRAKHPELAVHHWPDHAAAEEGLLAQVQEGDLVLLMGAGNVFKLADPLLARLRTRLAAPTGSPA